MSLIDKTGKSIAWTVDTTGKGTGFLLVKVLVPLVVIGAIFYAFIITLALLAGFGLIALCIAGLAFVSTLYLPRLDESLQYKDSLKWENEHTPEELAKMNYKTTAQGDKIYYPIHERSQ